MRKIFTLIIIIMLFYLMCGCVESVPTVNSYTVTFKDYDGTILREEIVQIGHSATVPNDPNRNGYIFTGWSEDYTNIQKHTICIAQYEKDLSVVLEYIVVVYLFDI